MASIPGDREPEEERNEYDDLLDGRRSEDKIALKQSMAAAATKTPDRSAQVIQLAQRVKAPTELVERNFDQVSKQADADGIDYDAMLEQSPKLAEWLKEHENAAVARDDVAHLGTIDWMLTAPARAFKRGQAQVEFGKLRAKSIFGDLTADEQARLQGLRGEMEAGGDLGATSWFGKAITGSAEQIPMLFGGIAAGAKTGIPAAIGAGGAVAALGQAGPQIAAPEEIVTVPSAAAAGYWVGSTTGSAMFGFEQEAGSAYEEFSQFKDELGQPLNPSVAKAAAIAAGSINAGLEAFQINTILRSIPGADKLVGGVTRSAIRKALTAPSIRGALGNMMLGYGKTLSTETVTEIAQRAVTIMSGELGKAVSGQDIKGRSASDIGGDLASEGAEAATSFALIVAPGHLAGGARGAMRAREAKKNEAFFKALGEGVANSKTFTRLPEKMQDFIAKATKDGPIENVYVPVQSWTTYWQSLNLDPGAAADDVLDSRADYERAVATGEDIAIPMSRYATKIAPTEHNGFFAKELRLAPDEMNAREAIEAEEAVAEEADAATQGEPSSSAAKVREDIVGQLLARGFDRSTVESYAQLYESTFRTLGERAGIDPFELYKQYGLKIERPMPDVLKAGGKVDSLDSYLDRLRNTELQVTGEALTQLERYLSAADIDLGSMTNEEVKARLAEVGEQSGRETNFRILSPAESTSGKWVVGTAPNGPNKFFDNEAEARAYFDEHNTSNFVVFDAKDVKVEEYFQDMGVRRGAIRFGKDRQFNIDIFARADLSTFLHETGHFYLEVMGDLADQLRGQEGLTEQQTKIVADYDAALKWLGVASRDEIEVDQHEKWARGLEAYLMEGKAPSAELRTIFARFRSWLVAIYRSLANLNVKLTDEVRGVMDRMIATDVEIEQAEREADITPMFADAASAGMSETEFAAYRATVQAASDKARETLQAKVMRQLTREREKWWKDERKSVVAEVVTEMNSRAEYVALSVLQRGVMPDGSPMPNDIKPFKLDRAWLVEQYGKDFLKRLPRGISSSEGLNPDAVSTLLGFHSGDELVTALANTRPMKAIVEAEADARMRERHGDMVLDGSISDVARAAVQNDEREKIIIAEMRALHRKQREVAPFVRAERAKERGRVSAGLDQVRTGIPPIESIRAMARGRIAQSRVRDLKPMVYLVASRRAAKAAIDAAVKKDYTEALTQKQRELMNVELYRAAMDARESVAETVEYMHTLSRSKARARIGKAGADYLDQIDGFLDRYEFARVPLKVLDRRASLMRWVQQKEKEGVAVNIADELLDDAKRMNYREMTVEQVTGVRDAVKHIEHLARFKNRLLKDKAKRELDAVAAEIDTSLHANATGSKKPKIETRLPSDEAARLFQDFFASHRKLSSLAYQMDGFKDGGAIWENIVRPLNEAGNAEAVMNEKATIALNKLFSVYQGREIADLYRKTNIPAIGQSLTKMARLMIALNWGNEGNRRRVLDGFGWNEDQVAAILDTLDECDWKFVQGVWDFIDSYWGEIEAKEKRVNGVAPDKVAAMPIETRFGPMRGGYFPIKYDDRQSAQAGAHLESDFADIAKAAAYVSASTRRGHTKERVTKTELPLRLDFSVIFGHVTQVIHDLSHHEALLDVSRVLGHKKVQAAIYETYGDIAYKQLKGSLLDIALGDVPAQTSFERSINWLRKGATIAGLGWNVMTSLLQPMGLAQSMVRIGPKWVGRGISRWMRDAASMENTVKWIHDRSDFMRLRGKTQQREINEISNTIGLKSGRLSGWVDEALRKTTFDKATKQGIVDSYFWLIQRMQMVADVPTWLGAYEKAMDGGAAEADAIALADQAVLDSQGGGQIKDLAGIQRGGPLLKIWTNFYSYFSVTYNLAVVSAKRTNFRDPASVGRLAVDMLLLYTLPATLAEVMRAALLSDGEEGEDGLVEKLVRSNLSYMFGSMVGLREIGGAVQGYAGYEGPAGTRFFSTFSRLVKQAEQGELDAALWRALNDVAGIFFHYPSGQIRRTVEGVEALAEGRTINPAAPLVGPPREP